MTMTVGELRSLIEGLDDKVEVRMAHQPSYPFEYSVRGLNEVHPDAEEMQAIRDALAGGPDCLDPTETKEAEERLAELVAKPSVLYVLEGTQLGYLSSSVWDI